MKQFFSFKGLALAAAALISLNAFAQRTFVDFKIDFRTNPYTVVLPADGTLPSNVAVTAGTYFDAQHGYQSAVVTVNVDGPVKFTIGGCNYTTGATVSIDGGAAIDIDTKAAGCDNGFGTYTKYATYTYTGATAAALTFNLGNYCPYFFAEATTVASKVNVHYFDVDGSKIGDDEVDGGTALAYKYGEGDVTVATGKAFRGWFASADATALKVAAGTLVTEELNLYAHVSDVEVAAAGSSFTYDLCQNYFYADDHELISLTNGSYHGAQHGWHFGSNAAMTLEVAGNATITLYLCEYGSAGTTTVKDAADNTVDSFDAKVAADNNTKVINYIGAATTLTFSIQADSYIHKVVVENAAGSATAIDNTEAVNKTVKVIRNGQVLFIRNGKTYNALGAEL